MLDWIFGKKTYDITVKINKVPQDNVVEEKPTPELNISEPVLSFVECVRNNPKRFSVVNREHDSSTRVRQYTFLDKKTAQEFNYTIRYSLYSNFYTYPEYLTKDEFEYVKDEVTAIFTARRNRLQELKEIRKERKNKAERLKLMDIYCNKDS